MYNAQLRLVGAWEDLLDNLRRLDYRMRELGRILSPFDPASERYRMMMEMASLDQFSQAIIGVTLESQKANGSRGMGAKVEA